MTDHEMLNLCFEVFRDQVRRRDSFSAKTGLAVTILVVLGGVAVRFGRHDLFSQFWNRPDVMAYYLGVGVFWMALVVAAMFLAGAIWPKEFKTIASLQVFFNWRDYYAAELEGAGYSWEECNSISSNRMARAIAERLCEASEYNGDANASKQQAFNRAVYSIAVAAIALLFSVVLHQVLGIQGI